MKKAASIMMLAVVCLISLGFVMLISLHVAHSGGSHRHLLPANLIIGKSGRRFRADADVAVARVDYRRWLQIATPFAGMVFMLLILALIPAWDHHQGCRRWVYLGPWGSFQPSILAGISSSCSWPGGIGTAKNALAISFWIRSRSSCCGQA
jgi:cell division protein FtsW (lipid II flippase)